jgi:hypothetical protein
MRDEIETVASTVYGAPEVIMLDTRHCAVIRLCLVKNVIESD